MHRPAPFRDGRASSRLASDVYGPLDDFRQALRGFLAFSEAGAREFGLTSQQHQALLAIRAHPAAEPITVSELAERLLIRTHSAVGLVARLVDRGLVERRVSSADRRRVQLILRPDGEAVLAKITHANLNELEGVARILGELLATVRQLQRGAGRPPAAED